MQGVRDDDPAISAKITAVRLSDAEGRARGFLLIVGGLFLVVFALPLLVAPFTWAEWFGWDVGPTPTWRPTSAAASAPSRS